MNLKSLLRCCFGNRDRSLQSLRASLVEGENVGSGCCKEEAAAAGSAGKNKGVDGNIVVEDVGGVSPSTSTSTSSSLAPPLRHIPFVRVDGSGGKGGSVSLGSAQSPAALAALLGVAERDARILLPPSSPAAPPPPAALFVRRRRQRRRESDGDGGEGEDLLLLVALEGVRLSLDSKKGVALVFSCPARPRGALDGCREPGLDDPMVSALADAARAGAAAAWSPSASSPSSFSAPSPAAALMLECALEAVCLALEERAAALEFEAAAAGDRLLASLGGGGSGTGSRGRKKTAAATKASAAAAAKNSSSSSATIPTREALEGLRRVKGELSDLRAAAARVAGALAPSRRRQRALADAAAGAVPHSSPSGRRSRSWHEEQQRRRRGGPPLTLFPPSLVPPLTWYEEAAEVAAERASAAAASAAASGEGARGAEAAVRLSLRRLGTMALFI